ncbi:hypothetical protein Q8W40_04305 [Vibrio penaeicida]|uniref:hypothetical protein n=1 Tax=Vibrio penaeicida TaxID=104609 RepID=UPI0027348913|nr:hypothetical protein [Vibrio penaeicida]MDP2571395.1 hypothetical protein [Vibrio penaeicida]
MFWGIAFSIYVIYLLGIIPLKIYHYWTGKETSALKVKIEEFSGSLFFSIGLIAVYGQINQQFFFVHEFWVAWLIIYTAYCIISLFYSPKMRHVANVASKKVLIIGTIIAHLVSLPLYYAVFIQAGF